MEPISTAALLFALGGGMAQVGGKLVEKGVVEPALAPAVGRLKGWLQRGITTKEQEAALRKVVEAAMDSYQQHPVGTELQADVLLNRLHILTKKENTALRDEVARVLWLLDGPDDEDRVPDTLLKALGLAQKMRSPLAAFLYALKRQLYAHEAFRPLFEFDNWEAIKSELIATRRLWEKAVTETGALRVVIEAEADIEALREDYLDYLRRNLAYLDLGGIAPKVANRTVKLPMRDIYVPVEAQRELDVQQLWQQVCYLLAPVGYLFKPPFRPSTVTLPPYLSDVDLQEIAARLADGGEDAAWRIFQERLARERPAKESASVKDILATPRAVLLGHPGTGKSTSLRYAAYAIAAGESDLVGEEDLGLLPILVRLAHYARAKSQDPTLCLRDYVRDLHDRDRAPLFRQCLEDGECLVMLDGLDEVIDPRQRAEIADQVEALVADYSDNHYLIASRIVGYEAGRLTGDFVHFTLGPLPESSIHGLVQKWYEAIEREGGAEISEEARARADELYQAIEERPGIRRLAENPLLLTIIALVNWKGRKLPNRRVEVYRHAAETLVESWPRRWRDVTFDAEEVLSLLEPVAYRIFADRSSEEIRESELLTLVTQAVAEIKPGMTGEAARVYVTGLLPRLSEHSGLFLERGFDSESGEPVFGFLHLTFAEYLAARYLAGQWEAEKDENERRAFLARYAHVPRWREVVLLMAQHVGLDGRRVPATQVLADLLQMETPYEDHLHRNLLLAGQCLADDLRVDPAAAKWVLDQMAILAVETPIAPLREQIAAMAREMDGTAYEGELASRLFTWLGDENAEARGGAVKTLGDIGSDQAVDSLLACLGAKHESADVRASAARALGKIKSERAVNGLLACLEDESESVRYSAAGAFRHIPDEQAVNGLLARLGDGSERVRISTAHALGQIGSERAVDDLLARLADESGAGLSAAKALGNIGSERAVNSLLARLEDESESVRYSAAWALGGMRDERVTDGLLARLEDENAKVRTSAAWALGRIGDERAVDSLLARLEDESADVRAQAARALGNIGSERAMDGLLARLGDKSVKVRASVVWALGQIGKGRVIEDLLAWLADESEQVCVYAASALGQIGSERAVDGLLARLEDESAEVRACVASALGQIRSERAVDGLLARLEDEKREVRTNAIWALGQIRDERAVDSLLAQLKDENDHILRSVSAEALREIKSERAIKSFLAWLSQKEMELYGERSVGLVGYAWSGGACDWAYTTILEILAHHAADPGVAPSPSSQELKVIGPWTEESS